jgi:hypothetical protein
MKLDIKIINEYVEKGLLLKQKHPKYPLWVYNYSRTCQYTNAWDSITMMCRALVLDEEGNIMARPVSKFFNYSQLESVGLKAPDETFDVYDKMDGSLIVAFYYQTEWIVMSKGSFTSDFAIRANELFNEYPVNMLYKNLTYCFELLWTKWPIVIVPKFDELIMLCAFDTHSGVEEDIQYDYYKNNFKVVHKYDGITDYTTLTTTIDGTNKEGFVVKFKSGFRMKIKFEEYLKLHSIVTNVSNIDIWEALKNGDDMEVFFEHVPDEFDAWVRNEIKVLKSNYNLIWDYSVVCYNCIHDKYNGDFSDKKSVAETVNLFPLEWKGILFNMVNEKSIDEIIWSKIRPTYQKPNF